jgi:glycosyltransferase involved in cell wall biosynthesis
MKVDLVLWARNGERTLPFVLDRINNVVPKDVVNNRIVVNDHSTDSTALHIKKCGWTEVQSEGHGISDAANTALKHVETEYFVSFEQDVILAADWWQSVSPLILGKENVAAACGLRFLPKQNFCSNVETYELIRKDIDYGTDSYGKTLDNTIWNTEVLRSVGGFPKLTYAGLDTYLHNCFTANGYQWRVNYNVKSVHYHVGFVSELRRYYFYALSLPQLYNRMAKFTNMYESDTLGQFLVKLSKSPVSALRMALKMDDGRLMAAYPAMRLCWLLGYIRGQNLQA